MKKYANDYETNVIKDEDGNEKKVTVYRGAYFEISLDEVHIIQFKRISLLLLVVIIGLHICGGFMSNRGLYQFYVSLPYVFVFFPLFYLAEGVLRLPKDKRKYRRDEIGLSFDRMKTSSFVLMTFFGLGVLGEIVFLLFFSAGNQIMMDYLYLALEVLAAAAVYILIRLQSKIRIQDISEESQP